MPKKKKAPAQQKAQPVWPRGPPPNGVPPAPPAPPVPKGYKVKYDKNGKKKPYASAVVMGPLPFPVDPNTMPEWMKDAKGLFTTEQPDAGNGVGESQEVTWKFHDDSDDEEPNWRERREGGPNDSMPGYGGDDRMRAAYYQRERMRDFEDDRMHDHERERMRNLDNLDRGNGYNDVNANGGGMYRPRDDYDRRQPGVTREGGNRLNRQNEQNMQRPDWIEREYLNLQARKEGRGGANEEYFY